MSRELEVACGIGDAYAVVTADGASYSPDLVHDMVQRAVEMLGKTLEAAVMAGYLDTDESCCGWESEVDDVSEEVAGNGESDGN